MRSTSRAVTSVVATVTATASAGLLAVVAMAAGGGDHASATAKPDPSATQGTATVLQSNQSLPGMLSLEEQTSSDRIALKGWTADSIRRNNIAWSANVRIHSGRYGAFTRCSDGSVRYGPKQGVGYWKFGGNCRGAGRLTGFGVYGSG